MLGEMRQQQLVTLINEQKSLKIRDLTELFHVSEETIRRDLKKLEHDGVLRRTHGGALLNEEVRAVPPIGQRSKENVVSKQAVANAAANLVSDRMTVMLDSGSTTLEIARKILHQGVTILTNDLTIALEVGHSEANLIVLGGVQQKGTFALIGHECEEAIRHYHVDIAFIGTGGIGLKQGLTTASSTEAELKRLMIESAGQVYCVADRSKIGVAALISFARVSDVDAIITDAEPDAGTAELERAGAQFLFAE